MLICLLELRPLLVADEPPNPVFDVIFSEILLGTPNSGSEEFIEINNNTDQPIVLDNWRLEYLSSSAQNWDSPTRTISLAGQIEPGAYILISSTAYATEEQSIKYSATLSQSGGHLRITSGQDQQLIVHDLMAWGTGKLGLGDSVLAPEAGSSIVRIPDKDGKFEPILNNIDDFKITTILTPLGVNSLPEPEVIDPESTNQIEEEQIESLVQDPELSPAVSMVYDFVQISELLPNPAEPQTDADDEFVELFNPNPHDVELNGYQLTAGLNASYKHTFNDSDKIAAGQFLIITSKDSSLTLSNTSGIVKLLDPSGETVYQTAEYGDAPEGMSLIFYDSNWQWSASPTPATANIFTPAPLPAAKQTTGTKKSASSKAKTSKAKTTAVKSAVKTPSSSSGSGTDALEEVSGTVNPLVLAGLGGLVILYASYEYRGDVKNKIHQFRANRANRRTLLKSNTKTG